MGPALITALGTALVGVLVFMASRLDASDDTKNLLRMAETLEKLKEGSKPYELLEGELVDALAAYHSKQTRARDHGRTVKLLAFGLASGVLGLTGLTFIQYVPLGTSRDIVRTLIGVALAVPVGVFLGNFGSGAAWSFIKRRRQREGARTAVADDAEQDGSTDEPVKPHPD